MAVADSPMSAYVFEGRSLGGLGAEITFFANAGVLLDIKKRLEARTPVGEAGRRYGFTPSVSFRCGCSSEIYCGQTSDLGRCLGHCVPCHRSSSSSCNGSTSDSRGWEGRATELR
jgi:hypothetical protein